MSTEQPFDGSPHSPAELDQAWTVFDIAEAFGRSPSWARSKVADWTTHTGLTQIGTDANTGARQFSSSAIRAAYRADQQRVPEPDRGPATAEGQAPLRDN